MTEFPKVCTALESLGATTSRDTWALADAVLEEIPVGGKDVAARLDEMTRTVAEKDLVSPDGDPYTAKWFTKMRAVAVAWPPSARHPEAAFRTHQAACSVLTGGEALSALCAYSRGQRPERPEQCDVVDWMVACERIDARRRRAHRPRFMVTGNDLQIALGRPQTVPSPPPGSDEVEKILHHLIAAQRSVQAFRTTFLDAEMNENRRTLLCNTIITLRYKLKEILEVVSTRVDDEALMELIEGEVR